MIEYQISYDLINPSENALFRYIPICETEKQLYRAIAIAKEFGKMSQVRNVKLYKVDKTEILLEGEAHANEQTKNGTGL